jgi:hypothetical protein
VFLVHRHIYFGDLFFLHLRCIIDWGQISHELLYLSAKFHGVTFQNPLTEWSLVFRRSALSSPGNLGGSRKDKNKKNKSLIFPEITLRVHKNKIRFFHFSFLLLLCCKDQCFVSTMCIKIKTLVSTNNLNPIPRSLIVQPDHYTDCELIHNRTETSAYSRNTIS